VKFCLNPIELRNFFKPTGRGMPAEGLQLSRRAPVKKLRRCSIEVRASSLKKNLIKLQPSGQSATSTGANLGTISKPAHSLSRYSMIA
jgi:hypothetical protein